MGRLGMVHKKIRFGAGLVFFEILFWIIMVVAVYTDYDGGVFTFLGFFGVATVWGSEAGN